MEFDPGSVATFAATINIASDDADEDPYNFAITGACTLPPAPVITSVTASDPNNGDEVLSNNDRLEIAFNIATNQGAGGAATGQNYTGGEMATFFGLSAGTFGTGIYDITWTSTQTLRIDMDDITGATIAIGATLTLQGAASRRFCLAGYLLEGLASGRLKIAEAHDLRQTTTVGFEHRRKRTGHVEERRKSLLPGSVQRQLPLPCQTAEQLIQPSPFQRLACPLRLVMVGRGRPTGTSSGHNCHSFSYSSGRSCCRSTLLRVRIPQA